MKHLLNLVGIAGFIALNYGIYQQFGEPITLMFGGSAVLLFSIRALQVIASKE